ncbi:hypothetical protein LTR78_001364 [Recurvomyces mirabilis]|uniref:Uncharacterized protein n=1 Tax=Recurvomyces mirabilis TaxID=574656 RepID=A0AAE0WVI0_9PEZI|nr:hypothetical protein LTR78_001364 [Recurvomyces mirabilis]KAK5161341.1 hypothetical protein LTS14_001137 [Recurvomyces mirabilis]
MRMILSAVEFADLAWLTGLLTLVAVLSTAYRQLIGVQMPLSQEKPMTSFFALAIETTQLLITTKGCIKLIFALEPVPRQGNDSLFLHVMLTLASLVPTLLMYASAVIMVDWLDTGIASSSLRPVPPAPFGLTRAMVFGPKRIWVREPAPLPPWSTSRSKRRRHQTQHSTWTLQTASRRIPQYEHSARYGPAPKFCGLHVSFADGVPAFSTERQLAQVANQTREQSKEERGQHYDALSPKSKHPVAPFTPPSSGEGFVRSRVRSLSATASPAASPLAGKSRTVRAGMA